MKCLVKKPFYDKYNVNRGYVPGDIVDWENQERIDDCVERGLIEVCSVDSPEEPETAHIDAESLESWKVEELKAMAKDMGIDTAGLKKKADLIKAITAAKAEED